MQFVYLDAGLRHDLGHHANYARLILRELRAQGISTGVAGNALVAPELRAELGVLPLFRAYASRPNDADPIVGWLNTFEAGAQMTFEDLRRLAGIGPDDLVYMGSMYHDLFLGLVKWAGTFDPARLPTLAADFCFGPGLAVRVGEDNQVRYTMKDPRVDPSAILYRYAMRRITPTVARRLTLATFDRPTSAAHQTLLGLPVRTWPAPIEATTSRRRRAGSRPVTVAVLGHQRPDKGYGLMPVVAAALLRERSDIRLLAHNGAPDFTPGPQKDLRRLAREDSRLMLDETIAGPEPWARLLDRSDLILCPYDPEVFATRFSSLACEAIANGIPLVVPARTSLSTLLADFGGPGTVFEKFEAAAIVEAVSLALDDFDRYAEIAARASKQWQQTHGPRSLVAQLLGLVPSAARATLSTAG